MIWKRDAETGGYSAVVPASVETWKGLRPYFAGMWAKLLADVPALAPPAKPPPRFSLCIDGRSGGGNIWLVLAGGGTLPAAARDPGLATTVNLAVPGAEGLVADNDDWEAANCRFAEEVLSAVRLEPALAAAKIVCAAHPKAVVEHEAVDPEHGWYVPFKVRLADLVVGKLPDIRWTFDFDEDNEG